MPELTLGLAEIRENVNGAGGNFTGDTSGVGLTGKWGGKFYSNGSRATDHPGAVAGTFGATSADGLQNILGGFGAYKQ